MRDKGLFQKVGRSLVPIDDIAVDSLAIMSQGEHVAVEVKQQRNPEYNGYAFTMLHALFDMQDRFSNFNQFRYWLTCKAGYIESQTAVGTLSHEAWAKIWTELPPSFRSVLTETRWEKLGAVVIPLLPSRTIMRPKSLSFGSMGEKNFRACFSAMVQAFIDEFGEIVTLEQLEQVARM